MEEPQINQSAKFHLEDATAVTTPDASSRRFWLSARR
jgi:hypothetical protein